VRLKNGWNKLVLTGCIAAVVVATGIGQTAKAAPSDACKPVADKGAPACQEIVPQKSCGDTTVPFVAAKSVKGTSVMKIGIIIETKEPEKAWNAFRFAVASKNNGHEVRVFLMGEAVECEHLTHEKFDVAGQLKSFVEAGGTILACGTCLKSRHLQGTAACPLSTMADCVKMVEWADKTVTF
jgi:sulfur relay (sulfurtransferase) complex TusBCD TusD component (DsrE family)